MRDADRAMERVMDGLRRAEAPEGLEARVLRSVAGRGEARARRGWTLGWGWGWPAGLAAAGVAVAVGLSLVPKAVRQVKPEPAVRQEGMVRPERPEVLPRGPETRPGPVAVRRVVRAREPRRARAVTPRRLTAAEEMRAPSRPAPEAPLTEQERLLVRFVRTASPVEIAALSPEVSARLNEQEEQEYQRFFHPPKSKEVLELEKEADEAAKRARLREAQAARETE